MIEKVTKGAPFKLKASDWNGVADFVNRGQQPVGGKSFAVHGEKVTIRNATSAELSRFSFVKPDGVVISPSEGLDSFCESPVFTVAVPDEGEDCALLCLDAPISAGEYGDARASGVCVVQFSTADVSHGFAVPDGLGGLKTADAGSVRVLYCQGDGGDKWGAVLLGGSGVSAGGGSNAYYKGYFKLSLETRTREVENPDYDPLDPESEEYVTEEYQVVHHSGGYFTVNGILGAYITAGDVEVTPGVVNQDVILHYHVNSGEQEDTVVTGAYVEAAPLSSNDEGNAYWLLGHYSADGVIQQSHGVPAMILAACREEEPQTEGEEEQTTQEGNE